MKKKVCFIATIEMSVKVFLTDHILLLQDVFDICVIVNTHDRFFLKPFGIHAKVLPVGIERKISPAKDIRALFNLYRIFREEHFDIVHSIMPKSGLLSMVAGFFARVPIRIHTFTGQVWKNSTGMERFIMKAMDKILSACATNILVDSPSQREFLISEGVVGRKKSSVIGNGSMCGVDEKRFRYDENARMEIRKICSAGPDEIVFFFLGRMKRDKGILDLAKAFVSLCGKYENVHLMVAGPDEEGVGDEVMRICSGHSNKVHIMGYAEEPARYMSAADVFCLPSYREGFGLVIVEAAAVGIPSIGSRIYGITDVIEDGITGYFFEPGAHHDLMLKMAHFVTDPSLIRTMGGKARNRALEQYSKEKITSAMMGYYRSLEKIL